MSYQDPERLQAVNRFLDLDINRKEELQEMVELAAALCYTPLAMITLMDDQIEYVKFGVGIDMKKQLREDTFCQYLIEGSDLMVVTDASRDPRFSVNPLVTGEPKVRFYAGCPLITHDGYNVGSLCVMGLIIKQLTEAQKHLLQVLAKRVVEIMELEFSLKILKKQFLQAKDSEFKLRSFFESAGTCHMLISKEFEIIAYNKNMADILQRVLRVKLYTGIKLNQIFTGERFERYMQECNEVLSGNPISYEREITYPQETLWWSISLDPGYNAEGEVIGISYNATNITERKFHEKQLSEKNECLLKIAHIQSHELRKPVASILGLMEIFKFSDYSSTREELIMLGKAAVELDIKIRAIISLTE